MALSLPCALSRFHNKRDFGEHNNPQKIFVLPSVFTPLTCFPLCLWIHECNTFLLNPCVQHICDTRLCTVLCKLLTRPLFFSTPEHAVRFFREFFVHMVKIFYCCLVEFQATGKVFPRCPKLRWQPLQMILINFAISYFFKKDKTKKFVSKKPKRLRISCFLYEGQPFTKDLVPGLVTWLAP